MADFTPTAEQVKVLDLFATGSDLAIEAGAGAGKTATLVLLAEAAAADPINGPRRGQYVAFSKALVVEAGDKFPGNVNCSTAHALAFRHATPAMKARLRSSKRMKSMEIARLLRLDPITISYGSDRKPMSVGYLAGLTMRTVENFCQSADPAPAERHVPYIDGIDVPTIDGKRTYGNNDQVRQHIIGAVRRAWDDLMSPTGVLPFKHSHYLKSWQLNDPIIDADFILYDECFPAGTVVETADGPARIEEIAAEPERDWMAATLMGGKVGYAPIRSAYRTPRGEPLVRVVHEHGTVIATANHPFVVGDARVAAINLSVGAPLFSVQDTASGPKAVRRRRRPALLLAGVRERVSAVHGGEPGGASGGGETERSCQQGPEVAEGVGVHAGAQPDAFRGDTGEGVRHAASNGAQAPHAGRERGGDAGGAAGPVGGAGGGVGARVCRVVWRREQIPRVADTLQDRRGEPGGEGSGRVRRPIPLGPTETGIGRTQGRVPSVSRVVRVEVLQPGDPDLIALGGDADHVYTLEVASESHTYFADGVAVGNCQDASPVLLAIVEAQPCQKVFVGDAAQAIFAFTGAVDALERIKQQGGQQAYLSQSFRFGDAVANVANGLLARIGSGLRLSGYGPVASVVGEVADPDVILTRTNARAVRHLLQNLATGRRTALVGGGAEVASFARACIDLKEREWTSHPELACFRTWGEVQDYVQQDPQGSELKLMVDLMDEFTPEVIIENLDRTTVEEGADVVISTAHRSKGREWGSVRLSDDFFLPRDGEEDVNDDELRLMYVAVTRAKRELDVTAAPQVFSRTQHEVRVEALDPKALTAQYGVRQ